MQPTNPPAPDNQTKKPWQTPQCSKKAWQTPRFVALGLDETKSGVGSFFENTVGNGSAAS
jgi:hypothetical protein